MQVYFKHQTGTRVGRLLEDSSGQVFVEVILWTSGIVIGTLLLCALFLGEYRSYKQHLRTGENALRQLQNANL